MENAYSLSFADRSVANLILFDVWHHLEFAPYIYPEHDYTLQDLARFLKGLGYECRDLKGRHLRNFGTSAISARGSVDVLMVPGV